MEHQTLIFTVANLSQAKMKSKILTFMKKKKTSENQIANEAPGLAARVPGHGLRVFLCTPLFEAQREP